MTNHQLSIYFLDIIMQLIRIQNEQLLRIISDNEEIELNDIKHLVPSPYEIKNMLTNF